MNKRLIERTDRPYRRPPVNSACIAALLSICLVPTTAVATHGDMNCDGAVNVSDIPLFVDALLATGSFGGCDIHRADVNGDTFINGRDVQPFVTTLVALCPGGATRCFGVCTNTAFDPQNCGGCGIVCSDPNFPCCSGGICQSCQ